MTADHEPHESAARAIAAHRSRATWRNRLGESVLVIWWPCETAAIRYRPGRPPVPGQSYCERRRQIAKAAGSIWRTASHDLVAVLRMSAAERDIGALAPALDMILAGEASAGLDLAARRNIRRRHFGRVVELVSGVSSINGRPLDSEDRLSVVAAECHPRSRA